MTILTISKRLTRGKSIAIPTLMKQTAQLAASVIILAMAAAGRGAEPAAGGEGGSGTVVLDDSTLWRQFHIDGATHVRNADGTLARGRIEYGNMRFGADSPSFFWSALPAHDWASPAFDDGAWPRLRFPQPTLWFREETRGCSINSPYAPVVLLARARFEIKDPAQIKACSFSLDYWGGAAVFVNGKEVARAHLPGNTTNLEVVAEDYPKEAFVTSKGKLIRCEDRDWIWLPRTNQASVAELRTRRMQEVRIPVTLLRKGVNVVAIETHAAPVGATDQIGRPGNDDYEKVGWQPIGLLGAKLTISPASAVSADGLRPKGIRVWNCAVEDTVTAFDYGDPGEPLRPITVHAGRNTVFSGRLMVGSDQPIKGLKVMVGDLALAREPISGSPRETATAKIPASAVRIRCAVWEPGKSSVGSPARFDGLLDTIPSEIPVSKAVAGPEGFYGRFVDRKGLVAGAVAPLWFTVRVPRDAKPGTYEGTVQLAAEGLAPMSVPLRVSVSAWTARDPKDFRQQNMLFSGEEGLAWHYKIPLWSDKHFEYMGKSLALASEVNSRMAIIPLVVEFHESISNPESFVRWIKQADGSFKYDFTLFDKYLDMVAKSTGKPRSLWLGWKCWVSGEGGAVPVARTPVTLLDPATGKVERMPQPEPGSAEHVAFWRPVFEEIRKKLQTRGWLDEVVFGYSDLQGSPAPAAVDVANKLWPGGEWTMYSHIGPSAFVGTDKNVVMKVRHYGACNDRRWPNINIPWTGKPSRGTNCRLYRDDSGRVGGDNLPLMTLRWRAEDTLRRGWDGSVFGLDLFPIRIPSAQDDRYYSVNRCNGARGLGAYNIASILYPGPDGPVATERFEVFREGLELSEALLDIEQASAEKKIGAGLLERVMRYREERAQAFVRGFFPAARMQAAEDAKLLDLAGEVARELGK
ncbi:MAG: glycoside hydrolase domain-containing protein [Verrucomicrobiota bacterium]